MVENAGNDNGLLAHPVYLDVPMLVGFLATVDNGVAHASEVAERLTPAPVRQPGFPRPEVSDLTRWLGLALNPAGGYTSLPREGGPVEAGLVREHTSASLFALLRERLSHAGRLTRGASGAGVGDLVEVRGTVGGDPLRRILDLMTAVGPYVGFGSETAGNSVKPAVTVRRRSMMTSKSSSGELDAERMFRIVRDDLDGSGVLDLTMRINDGQCAVLTVSREYLAESGGRHATTGSFTVLGKVTGVLGPGERLGLLRRTVFAPLEAAGEVSAEEVFAGLTEAFPSLGIAGLAPTGPGLQILPLAIYV